MSTVSSRGKISDGRSRWNALLIMGIRASALASKFVLTLFIAKFLGIEAVGQYGYLAGAAAILPIALGLGFMQELSRRLVVEGMKRVLRPLLLYWLLVAVAYVCLGAAMVWLNGVISLGPSRTCVMLAAAVLLLEHLNNDAFFVVSNLKRPLFANVQVFLRAASWILVYIPFALFWPALRSMEVMLLFWLAGIGISFIVFAWECLYPEFPPERGHGVSPAGVLGQVHALRVIYAGELVNTLGVYADRYLIGAFLGTKAAGIYVLFSSLALGVYNLVNTGVMQVMRPYLIEHHAHARKLDYRRVHVECMRRSMLSAVMLSVTCGVAFHVLLPYLGRPELDGQELLLWLLLLGVIVRLASDVQGYVFYTCRQDGRFLSTSLVAVIAFLVIGTAALPALGLLGGVLSFLAAYMLTFMVRTALIIRDRKLDVE